MVTLAPPPYLGALRLKEGHRPALEYARHGERPTGRGRRRRRRQRVLLRAVLVGRVLHHARGGGSRRRLGIAQRLLERRGGAAWCARRALAVLGQPPLAS